MDHPDRPSRHRSHDKWKRIIEPAGDSDSSDWSSDSDVGLGMHGFHYRHLDNSLGGASSSNKEQMSFLSHMTGGEKKAQIYNSPNVFSFFNHSKRFDSQESNTRTTSLTNTFNHLLHHDYAEREVNTIQHNNDNLIIPFSPTELQPHDFSNSDLQQRKRKQTTNTVIDYSNNLCIPSTSTCDFSAVSTSEEGPMPDSDNTNVPASTASSSSHLHHGEDNGIVDDRGILNPPIMKRPLLDHPANQADSSNYVENGPTLITGCLNLLDGTQTRTQDQSAGNPAHDNDVEAVPGPSNHAATPKSWFPKIRAINRNKRVRFDNTVLDISTGGNVRDVDRDCEPAPDSGPPTAAGSGERSRYACPARSPASPCSSEDTGDIEVLSMAGPPRRTHSVCYLNGTPQKKSKPGEASASEETQTNLQRMVEDGDDVIMINVTRPESTTENQTDSNAPDGRQQPQQEQEKQPAKENADTGSPRLKEEESNFSRREDSGLSHEDSVLNQGLISLLECPVCMEYMGPPIHQCRRGHLVCTSCKPKLPSCPTCRSRFTESRNLAMEKVADKLHYPCKNAHMGCLFTLRLRDKDDHEANCFYRNYRCIMVPPCEWKGQHRDILTHVKQAHANSLLKGPEHILEMRLGDFTEQSSHNWIVSTFDKLFRVNLGAVRGGRVQVFGCVLFLGPARFAPQYRYTLTVGPAEDDPAKRMMTYCRATHCYVERCSVYYSAGDSFHLRTESAQLFSTGPPADRVMSVKLRIEDNSKRNEENCCQVSRNNC